MKRKIHSSHKMSKVKMTSNDNSYSQRICKYCGGVESLKNIKFGIGFSKTVYETQLKLSKQCKEGG